MGRGEDKTDTNAADLEPGGDTGAMDKINRTLRVKKRTRQ